MEIQWKTAKWKPDTNSSHSVLGRIKLHHLSTFKDCDLVIVHPQRSHCRRQETYSEACTACSDDFDWDGNNVWIRCAMVMIVQLKSDRITYPSCRTAVSNGVTRTHEAKLWQRYCLHPKRASFTSSSSVMIHPLPAFWIVWSVSASRAEVASQKQFHAKLMSNTAMHLSSSVLIKK